MAFDPKSNLTFTNLLPPISRATNNAASAGVDLKGYAGAVAVRVSIGVQTAGDNAATFTVQLQSSATNSAAAATNISGASMVSDGNNAATDFASIQVDPRACLRYLFGRVIITGGNSPAAPISADLVGVKQTQ